MRRAWAQASGTMPFRWRAFATTGTPTRYALYATPLRRTVPGSGELESGCHRRGPPEVVTRADVLHSPRPTTCNTRLRW